VAEYNMIANKQVEDKIMILRQFEEENNMIQRESAHVAYDRRKKPCQRNKMNVLGNESEIEGCYMCGSEEHYARKCELKEKIFEFGKKLCAESNEQKSKQTSKLR
jgi:hypothetical protein